MRARWSSWAAALTVAISCTSGAGAQTGQAVDLPGHVIDAKNGQPVADVILRVMGTDISAATDAEGTFILRGLAPGTWTLRASHVAYGSHESTLQVDASKNVALEVRLTSQAIELEPLVVQTLTQKEQTDRGRGSSRYVVDREKIEKALGTTQHMGELIARNVPGMRLRQPANLSSTDVCLEFRAAASVSMTLDRGCNSPLVLLDGVPVSDPNFLYGGMGLQTVQRIQVVPPGEAGSRYGSGALYGAILIDTRYPGTGPTARSPYELPPMTSRRGSAFDWSQDPQGHSYGRALAGAAVGNALGLAAGLAIGRQCIGVDELKEIVTTCPNGQVVLAGAAAMILPALGSALGARLGGKTDLSVGRLIPAIVGAGMIIFPGYAFSMSTVGGGSEAANAVGNVFLVVGTPLVTAVADRIFRKLRGK